SFIITSLISSAFIYTARTQIYTLSLHDALPICSMTLKTPWHQKIKTSLAKTCSTGSPRDTPVGFVLTATVVHGGKKTSPNWLNTSPTSSTAPTIMVGCWV